MSSRTLGIRKFDRILLASSIEMIVDILIGLIDSAVTGHVIGMAGLSAMNVIAPALGFTVFTENLFSVGTSMLYAKHTGEYQREASERVFGMGLGLSTLVGVLTFGAVTLFLPAYLDAMGVYGQVREYITIYMSFLRFELLLSPIYEFTDRGGCWFCPNAKESELQHLYDHHPELWNRMLALQAVPGKVTEKFNRTESFADIDRRFKGGSIQ